MKPGDIVICTDARLSEGRLKEGWRYVVSEYQADTSVFDWSKGVVPDDGFVLTLIGTTPKIGKWWKSSRFRPLTRKEVEDQVMQKVADKLLKTSGGVE